MAVVSATVWAHHMFASGTPEWVRLFFMFTTELVAVPTGVKVFAWTATVWRSRLHLDTPILFALGGVVMFLIGGITGVMQGAMPFDLHVNNTHFIVAHFHYVVYNTITVALYGGLYYWYPKVIPLLSLSGYSE